MSRRSGWALALAGACLVAVCARVAATRGDPAAAAVPARASRLGPAAGGTPATNLAAVASSPRSRVDRTAEGPAESSGSAAALQVWDADRERPVAAVRVRIDLDGGERATLLTDPEGRVSLAALDEHAIDRVELEGADIFPLALAARELAALPSIEDLRRIEVRPRGRLQVDVSSSGGSPVANVFVEVRPIDPGTGLASPVLPEIWPSFAAELGPLAEPTELRLSSVTDATGRVDVPLLPCGTELLIVARHGGAVRRTQTTIDPELGLGRVLLAFDAACRVSGTLAWEDGEPAEGVLVRLYGSERAGAGALEAPSDSAGRFVFPEVRSSSAMLRVDSPGEPNRQLRIDGPQLELGTLVLVKPSLVEGRLLATGLEPDVHLGGIRVEAVRDGLVTSRARTDRDGSFRLALTNPPTSLVARCLGRGVLARQAQTTALRPPLTLDLDRACGSIGIELVGAGAGAPAVVWLRGADGAVLSFPCAADAPGVHVSRADKAPGWNVTLHAVPSGRYALFVDGGEGAAAWVPEVDVHAGRRTELGPLRPGFGEVRGQVLGVDGRPALGVEFTLTSSTGRASSAVSTDAGELGWSRVAPGEWTVAGPGLDGGQRIAVRAGEVAEFRARVPGNGWVEGVVTGPLPQRIRLLPAAQGWFGEAVADVGTRAGGDFGPLALPAGSYVAALASRGANGRLTENWRDLCILPGKTTRVVFDPLGQDTELAFLRAGEPVLDVTGGFALFAGGQCTLDFGNGRSSAALGQGPWLFALETLRDLDPEDLAPVRGHRVGVATGAVPPPRLAVDLGGVELRVDATRAPESLGGLRCELIALEGFDGVLPAGWALPLAGEVLDAGVLSVAVPSGGRVRLSGCLSDGERVQQTVECSGAAVQVAWPPEVDPQQPIERVP